MSVSDHDAGSIGRSLATLGAAVFLIVAWALPGSVSTAADDAAPAVSAAGDPAADDVTPDPTTATEPAGDEPAADPTPPESPVPTEPDPALPESPIPTEPDPTPPDSPVPTEPDPTPPDSPVPTEPDPTLQDTDEPTANPTLPGGDEPVSDPALPDGSEPSEPAPDASPSGTSLLTDEEATGPTVVTTTEPPPPTTATPTPQPVAAPALDDGGTDASPTRIIFQVVWQRSDGSPIGAPDEVLPSGWRDAFVVSGEAATGGGVPTSATCTYPASGGDLECTYLNPGHEGGTGLVMPARETATYRVSVAGSPDGWSADGSTVGTFVGFETCPPGGGTCTHVVRMLESSTPPPTTTDPGHGSGHGSGQGNPTRILFEVRWRYLDGSQSTSPDGTALPPGSWDSFVLQGESETGSGRPTLATCSYSASGGGLECTYVNPGHDDGTGLVVRANASATYDVSVSGIPAGWSVDGSTVGTFVGRDVCPRGEDAGSGGAGHTGGGGSSGEHPDGGHTEVDPAADSHTDDDHAGGSGGHDGGGGGSGSGNIVVCTHVVDLVQQAATTTTTSTTPTTTTSTTTAPTTTTTTTTEPVAGTATTAAPVVTTPGTAAVSASGARTLPSTGQSSTGLVVMAAVITLVGIGLARLSGARRAN